MQRRGFIKALLAGSAAAVAAHFGVSVAAVPEIKAELRKELRTGPMVAMNGKDPWMGDAPQVWWSVGAVADVWKREIQRQHPDMTFDSGRLFESCRRMAKAIDIDAMKAQIKTDAKVIVDVPRVCDVRTTGGRMNAVTSFSLKAGLETKASLWGNRFRVGYIQEKIYTGEEIDETKRLWVPGAS